MQGLGALGRHYLEMVVAMVVGMMAFGVLFVSPLDPLGYREWMLARPLVRELWMIVAMSVPMAGYMVWRGHGWPRTVEMVAGMAVPGAAVVWLASMGVVGLGGLTLWSHVAMLLGMAGAMWVRRSEYASHDHSGHSGHAGHAGHAGHSGHSMGGR